MCIRDSILSEQTGLPRTAIHALVMGEHGDSSMIPYSALRLDGRPADAVPGFDPEEALRRTHDTGMDIIDGKGSTEFGIGQAAAFLIDGILRGETRTLPLSTLLRGEYSAQDIPCGVPCVIGPRGIERVVEIPLKGQEKSALDASLRVLDTHRRLALTK